MIDPGYCGREKFRPISLRRATKAETKRFYESKIKPNYPTAAEDRAIRAGIAADPDTREMTAREIRAMRPYRPGGRAKLAHPKELINVRLDPDVLQFFRSDGAGWQTRLNAALVEYVAKTRRKRTRPRRAK